jgi:hypothetical protein
MGGLNLAFWNSGFLARDMSPTVSNGLLQKNEMLFLSLLHEINNQIKVIPYGNGKKGTTDGNGQKGTTDGNGQKGTERDVFHCQQYCPTVCARLQPSSRTKDFDFLGICQQPT